MDRLSTLDAEFLHLEDGITHMHIAGVSVFEGPPPDVDEVVALLASKLERIPRYRQRVRTVPLELGRPVWVDDPHFNLAYHVRHTALPAPGDDRALRRLMGRLMSQPLDRNRPLWEAWCAVFDPLNRTTLVGVAVGSPLPDLALEFETGHRIDTFGNSGEGYWWYYRDRVSGEVFEAGGRGIVHERAEVSAAEQ